VDGAASQGAHLAKGTDVGGYHIDGELGSGGMGVVYAATHPLIGKRAAIKVLRPDLSNNPAAVERFVMEARAVNQIGHPNIVDIFAFGQLPDGRRYYVMDLLSGESLRRRLKRGGPLHVSEAASVIDEVTSALIAAHDKGIIHRDLKPDNVFMVTVPGRWPEVRLLDWGLLKLSSTQNAVSSGRYKTLAGSMMGTPVYMSPEQARASDSVDSRTDIYSLGVMAYEILSGVVPFSRGTSIDTLLAHQDEPVPPLAAKCPGLPEELVQLIEAMLTKDPDGRPTLAAVRAVIKRLKGGKIPTMTAAGLSMPMAPLPPVVDARGQNTDDNPTIDDRSNESMYPTIQRGPEARLSSEMLPLPPPPKTPMHGEIPRADPFGSLNNVQTTLAGHQMPVPVRSKSAPIGMKVPHEVRPSYPLQPHANAASGPMPMQSYPHPSYSTPPSGNELQATPYHSGSLPHHSAPPQYGQPQYSGEVPLPHQSGVQPSGSNKQFVVILVIAILAAAVGIALLLAN
jgi:serine/threonine protein kinase